MSEHIVTLMNVRPRSGEVGLEIEMEGMNLLRRNLENWSVHTDGSLRGYEGLEYVLKTPVKERNIPTVLNKLTTAFTDVGATLEPNERCGVHVHINCQNNTTQEVINFVCYYLILEQLLMKWCGPKREGNLFCLRAIDAEAIIDGLVTAKRNDDLSYMLDHRYRYASVNLCALGKFGSVEFRGMETPKNLARVNKWVRMLMKIKRASLEMGDVATILEGISFDGADQFIEAVLGKDAEGLSAPPHDDLMVGVRLVQDIAYTQVQKNPPKVRHLKRSRGVKYDEVLNRIVQQRLVEVDQFGEDELDD